MEVKFNEVNVPFECFVIPDLITPLLIGNEFSFAHESGLFWLKRIYKFTFNRTVIECPFVVQTVYGINFVSAVPQNIQEILEDKLSCVPLCIRERLIPELLKYGEVFHSQPGLTDKYAHNIVMQNENPFVQRSYPVPYAVRPAVETELKRMEDLKIIRRATSDYSSPMTVVKKKDGSVRICLDARYINKNMVNDVESPQPIEELIQKFHGCKILSVIDLRSSYWQIPLTRDSRKYTAFRYNGRLYEYLVLPFGLKTAVASFSRAMDKILGSEVRTFVTTYVDDLLIASKDREEHCRHLSIVLEKLNKAHLTINLEKTQFFKPEVKFLGYLLSEKGILPDPEKVEAIVKFPTPKRPKDIRAFLGLCNYYRRFQVEFATYAKTLQQLIKKGVKWIWEEEEENAFNTLKENFLKTVILAHPDPKLPFVLQTDSSDIGLGGVLYQVEQSGNELVIQFMSRAFRGPELNYTTTEKELLAVVYCLKKVRLYLLGNKFTIKTDHHALQFLKPDNIMHDRLVRWLLFLQNFDYEIIHIKGKSNLVPDLLSRRPHDQSEDNELRTKEFFVAALPIENKTSLEKKLRQITQEQRADENLKEIIQNPTPFYKVENGVLYHQKTGGEKHICLPTTLVVEVISYLHQELGHSGTTKTYSVLAQYFHCKNLYKEVKRVVTSCDSCQKSKCANRKYEGLALPIIPETIGSLVAVDYFGPLPSSTFGMTYIFVVLDVFSKFVKLYPIGRATTAVSIKKIQDFQKQIKIQSVLADHGSQFKSPKWHDFLKACDIHSGLTSINHPASNPAERVMRELGRMLRTYCHDHNQGWYKVIADIENCFNTIPHESTGVSAFEIVHGKRPERNFNHLLKEMLPPIHPDRDLMDKVRERLRFRAERRKIYFDKRIKKIVFEENSLVLLRKINYSIKEQKISQKLQPLYEGHYIISKLPFHNVATLVDPKTKKIRGNYNFSMLKPYKSF